MTECKNPRAGSAGASISIAADIEVSNQNLTFEQALSQEPKPFVSFCQGPEGRTDRFLIQGAIDRDHIGIAAQALIDLLDAIDGDPDLEPGADAEQSSWGNDPCQLGLQAHCMDWHHDDAEEDDPGGSAEDGSI